MSALHPSCSKLVSSLGCTKAFREMLRWPKIGHAGARRASSRDYWDSQKWYLGRAENNRMCLFPRGVGPCCTKLEALHPSITLGPIRQLRRAVSTLIENLYGILCFAGVASVSVHLPMNLSSTQ